MSAQSPKGLRRHLSRAASATVIIRFANLGISLGVGVLLARLMGAEGFGVYAFAMALVGMLGIPATLGLPTLIVRESAIYWHESQYALLRGLLRRADQLILATSFLLAPALWWLGIYSLGEEGGRVMLLGAALLPLTALIAARGSALRGLNRIVASQLPEQILRPGALLLGVTAVFLLAGELSPADAMGVQLLVSSLALAVSVIWLRRALPGVVWRAPPVYATGRWARSAVPFLFLGGVALINNQLDLIMLGLLRSAEEVGIYRACVAAAQLVIFVLQVFNFVISPALAQLYRTGDNRRLQSLVTATARAALLGSLPVALVLGVFGGPVLGAVFGAEFSAGAAALAILCVGQLINAAMGPVGNILNMTGFERHSARAVAIAAAVNAALNLALVPRWGMEGAAVATAVSMTVWNVLLGIWVKRLTGLNPTAIGATPRRRE